MLIARAALGRSWENDPGTAPTAWRKRVRQRLTERPEATRASALAGLPRLSPPRDVPLGVPSARQEFFVTPTGDWLISGWSLNTDNGRDAQRWVFTNSFGNQPPAEELRAVLDTRMAPAFDGRDREAVQRDLEDGHLPLIHVRWQTGPILYHHELATLILAGDYGDDGHRRGDETVVLLTRLSLTNTAAEPQTATVNLRYNLDWPLRREPDGLLTVDWPAHRPRPDDGLAVRGQAIEGPSTAETYRRDIERAAREVATCLDGGDLAELANQHENTTLADSLGRPGLEPTAYPQAPRAGTTRTGNVCQTIGHRPQARRHQLPPQRNPGSHLEPVGTRYPATGIPTEHALDLEDDLCDNGHSIRFRLAVGRTLDGCRACFRGRSSAGRGRQASGRCRAAGFS